MHDIISLFAEGKSINAIYFLKIENFSNNLYLLGNVSGFLSTLG